MASNPPMSVPVPDLDPDLNNVLLVAGQGDVALQHFLISVQCFRNLFNLEQKMSAQLDSVNAAVTALQTSTAALIGRVDDMAKALAAAVAANDPAALQQVSDNLNKLVSDEQAALSRDTLPASGGGAGAGTATGTGSGSAAPAA